VTLLGALAANSYDGAGLSVNARGDVVGASAHYPGELPGSRWGPVLWSVGSTAPIELGTLPGTQISPLRDGRANGINAAGTVVGTVHKYAGNADMGLVAVRWAPGSTTPTELLAIGSTGSRFPWTRANAINNAGVAIGWAVNYAIRYEGSSHATRWDADSTVPVELGTLETNSSGEANAEALAINFAGVIAGCSQKWSGTRYLGYRPVRWDAGGTTATELANLGLDPNGATAGSAVAINDAGTIVGGVEKYVDGIDLGSRAVYWSAGQTALTELPGLATGASGASGINAAGDIVGYSVMSLTEARATLWPAGSSVPIDLNQLIDPNSGCKLEYANAINDAGVIVGSGVYYPPDGGGFPRSAAFRLDPVPEPLLLAPVLVAGWLLVRRRSPAGSSRGGGNRGGASIY
jgi:uncharacterized membrane protein